MSARITGAGGVWLLWCGLALLAALPGCGDDDGGDPDAGNDAGEDSATADANQDTGSNATCSVGTACDRMADCNGAFCATEQLVQIVAEDLPQGDALEVPIFPGGLCSPTPFRPYSDLTSCDFLAPLGRQGCGACGVCTPEALNGEFWSICREACEPDDNTTGCSRSGYTCDLARNACIEGCVSDEQCRLRRLDTNADGQIDTARFDPESTAFCDPGTLRCAHPGTNGATAGDPCMNDEDCEENGRCITNLQPIAGFAYPGGYCSKRGCDVGGLECAGDEAACVQVRGQGLLSTPHCMRGCQRGAEPEADVLGVDGHGAGCRPGYTCAWDGVHGVGATDNGVCVGGNYNDIATNNIGVTCETSAECYSPYGQGLCVALSVNGVSAGPHCAIADCAVPGTPADVCGAGAECIGFAGDSSYCVQTCVTADECADGLACSNDDMDASTTPLCYPTCNSAQECRDGEECLDADGVATTREKVCRG